MTTEAPSSQLTIRQAAAALGLSVRTMRRRIAEGEVSATKQRRGKQDVTILDAAEVARWAQANGVTMAAPGQQVAAPSADIGGSPGQSQEQDGGTVATPANDLGQAVAVAEGQAMTMAAQQVTIQTLQQQVEFLQQQLRLMTERALPPAPQEKRQGWWARWFGKGER